LLKSLLGGYPQRGTQRRQRRLAGVSSFGTPLGSRESGNSRIRVLEVAPALVASTSWPACAQRRAPRGRRYSWCAGGCRWREYPAGAKRRLGDSPARPQGGPLGGADPIAEPKALGGTASSRAVSRARRPPTGAEHPPGPPRYARLDTGLERATVQRRGRPRKVTSALWACPVCHNCTRPPQPTPGATTTVLGLSPDQRGCSAPYFLGVG